MDFDPQPIVERYRDLVEDWDALLESLQTPLPLAIWANTLRISPSDLQALLEKDGLHPKRLPWNPDGFVIPDLDGPGKRWWYRIGLAHSQEEVSQIPTRVLDPQPGERVLDLCAAPGGKTAQMAVAMNNTGTIVANDISLGRMQPLRHNQERLGLLNICITRWDGSNYPKAAGLFDRVLVDAPCSCEGTVRRHGLPGKCGAEASQRFANSQKALMRRAIALCRPGGRIVYSTCTFAPEENEAVVDHVLQAFADQVRLLPVQVPGMEVSPGVTQWNGENLNPAVAQCARVWPHQNDSGGFFIAAFERVGQAVRDVPEPVSIGPIEAPLIESHLLHPFGIPDTALDGVHVFRKSSKGFHVAYEGLRPPEKPALEAAGFLALGTKSRPAKPSTHGAAWLAPKATKQVIDLKDSQREAYLDREVLILDEELLEHCERNGYVMIRYRGFGLGTGVLNLETRELGSLFPMAR